jgi:asparagine synthase (glutamine-hydrolysing)
MSGIGGVQTTDGSPPSAILLSALGRALQHRGPKGGIEGEIQFTSGGAALLRAGAKAEAISGRSPQSMAVTDGGVALDLQAGASLSRTALAAAASACGLALAACEPQEDRIILSRDMFGLRPLYYAETERGLIFASEPRAIIASGFLEPRLRPEAAAELLQIQFTTGRRTLFDRIQRVLPGESLVAERGRIVERVAGAHLPRQVENDLSEMEALAQLETLLSRALESAFSAAAHAAGLLFDGRIEALALAAGLKILGRRGIPLLAVTAGGADLVKLAESTAKATGGEAVILELGAADFFAALPRVVALLDDPGADYSAIALHRIAEASAGRLTALLSPAGGDVLFGGLGRYRMALRPLWLGGRAMRARGFMESLGILKDEPPSWRDGLRATESRFAVQGFARLSRLQALQAVDCAHWLPDDVLPVLDRCLWAHGIEPHAPYLDPALATFAFTLPDALKISPGRGSILLRRWLARTMPASEPFARHRAPPLPVARWIAAEAPRLAPLIAASAGIRRFCREEAVLHLFERLHLRPAKRLGHAAWQLVFFALWHRIHIEGKVADGSVFDVLS